MFISVSAFAIMNLFAKYLQHLPPFELVFFRSVGSFIIGMLLLLKNDIPILGTHRRLLFSRGVIGMISMVLFFWAIQLLPFGSAVSLRYLSPIFAAIMAVFLLKERITPLQWLCFIMAFMGVILLKGFDTRVSFFGLIVICVSALCSGIVYIIIRKIGKREHPLVVVNYFMFIATLVGGILSLFNWIMPIGVEWVLLLSMGILGFFGQIYMTKAYQMASIGIVAPLKYLEAVFALFVGWIWFGEGYTFLALVGIALVVSGMILNLFAKQSSSA